MPTFKRFSVLISILCLTSFHSVLSLSVFEERDNIANTDKFAFSPDGYVHHRVRRDAHEDRVYMKVSNLTVPHQQLIVHWVGNKSNITICMARDSKDSSRNKIRQPSAIFYSYDYGDSHINRTDLLKPKNGTVLQLDKFYIHPKYTSRTVFVDSTNRMIYVTEDNGKTFMSYSVGFTPSDISFHPTLSRVFLAHDKVNGTGRLYITYDFGSSWQLYQQFVKSFDWFSENGSPEKDLIVQRLEPDGSSVLIKLRVMTADGDEPSGVPLFAHAVDMYIKGDFIFVTMNVSRNGTSSATTQDSQDLYVKYRGGAFLKASFGDALPNKDFHVADITENRILVAVGHSSTLCNLHVSNIINEKTQKLEFSLALDRIFCYFPNIIPFPESMSYGMSDTTYADLHKVEGMRGIYIASQVLPTLGSSNHVTLDHLVTKITFNWGVTWNELNLTHQHGQFCKTGKNCSLHLTHKFASWFPLARYMPILSSKSAPGLIIATGVYGNTMKGHPGVYISRDAGVTWRQAMNDSYYYNIGDHGGIIVAIKFYKTRDTVASLFYSTDEGETWNSTRMNEALTVYSLMTEPGENTTIFSLFGSGTGSHKWVIIKADFRGVFNNTCTIDDMKEWSPKNPYEKKMNCLMGRKEVYLRRAPRTNCYIGATMDDRPIRAEICDCDRTDFMCDDGFYLDETTEHCVRNKTDTATNVGAKHPYAIPDPCPPYTYYSRTKGYKKIPGDVCENGDSTYFLADSVPCPIEEKKKFLLLAQKERIVTFSLDGGVNSTRQDVLPISGLQNVIAVEYDMRNECVYYADIVSDVIYRWSLSSGGAPVRIVDTQLDSVEGMAYDWISKHLYFVDGGRGRIDVIRTDIDYEHRFRTTVINNGTARKPRGIAIHPIKGYMFWTDWAIMSLNRANLDGSNDVKLFTRPTVEWPNGVTVDFISDRIYWVDARQDFIASSDLNGNGFKKILDHHAKVSHPFSIAVYKDDMYWDDWRTNAIYLADKDNVTFIHTVATSLPGLMDLKIYAHSIQEGTNACTNNTKCSHLCFGMPEGKFVCRCPDHLQLVNETRCVCPGNREPIRGGRCPSAQSTCAAKYFRCKNGDCIPESWKCDGDSDCADGSDELCNVTVTCPPNFFRCGNGKCIPEYWKCDYDFDCPDRADESNCTYPTCKLGQFKCDNGRCIAKKWNCDGENDCRDGSDEKNCRSTTTSPATCRDDEFSCGAGQCISQRWVCDNEPDCTDGSDEANCTAMACDASYQFQCGQSRKCILKSWKCDGENDCGDNSDEENCTDTKTSPTYPIPVNPATCASWMFHCSNMKCVPYWWKCDHINDCGDNSDELGCSYDTTGATLSTSSMRTPTTTMAACGAGGFRCDSGECIRDRWVCDGMSDCNNGEDEKDCEGVMKKCKNDEFQCHRTGMCIMIFHRCDGVLHCPDGSDEEDCNTRNATSSPPSRVSCAAGYFACDGGACIPLHKKCDGHINCYDESDETNCTASNKTYQVIDLKAGPLNHDWFRLSWHVLPIPSSSSQLLYLPSIGENNVWKNHSAWIDRTTHTFENLTASTTYNVTVYVKEGQKVFPPAYYLKMKTMPGKPDPPRNLTSKIAGDFIEVRWLPPLRANGEIRHYTVRWVPPFPPQLELVESYEELVANIRYQPNTTYAIWVWASNALQDSDDSEKLYVLTPAWSQKDVYNLTVVSVDHNSASLRWKSSYKDALFQVGCKVKSPAIYPPVKSSRTNETNVTVAGLSPGVQYTCGVSLANVTDPDNTRIVAVNTSGSPFPSVSNINVTPGNSVMHLTWSAVNDTSKHWKYSIYYGDSIPSLLEESKATVDGTNFTLRNLPACTKFLFNVGVYWMGSEGPLSKIGLTVASTGIDPRAAPRDLRVSVYSLKSLKIKWRSSCILASDMIGYEVTIVEVNSNKRQYMKVPKSNEQTFTLIFNGTYDCVYNVSVKTTEKDANSSEWVQIATAHLPVPYQVVAQNMQGKGVLVRWDADKSNGALMYTPHSFEVVVGEGAKSLNQRVYPADSSPLVLKNLKEDTIYTVAVRIVTKDGHRSALSEDTFVDTMKYSASVPEPTEESTSLVWPIVLILLLLGSCVGFIYWKQKRSPLNFKTLAHSHYDTRSGSATFSGVNGLDMDDTPEMRETFSDDEPLVIA